MTPFYIFINFIFRKKDRKAQEDKAKKKRKKEKKARSKSKSKVMIDKIYVANVSPLNFAGIFKYDGLTIKFLIPPILWPLCWYRIFIKSKLILT